MWGPFIRWTRAMSPPLISSGNVFITSDCYITTIFLSCRVVTYHSRISTANVGPFIRWTRAMSPPLISSEYLAANVGPFHTMDKSNVATTHQFRRCTSQERQIFLLRNASIVSSCHLHIIRGLLKCIHSSSFRFKLTYVAISIRNVKPMKRKERFGYLNWFSDYWITFKSKHSASYSALQGSREVGHSNSAVETRLASDTGKFSRRTVNDTSKSSPSDISVTTGIAEAHFSVKLAHIQTFENRNCTTLQWLSLWLSDEVDPGVVIKPKLIFEPANKRMNIDCFRYLTFRDVLIRVGGRIDKVLESTKTYSRSMRYRDTGIEMRYMSECPVARLKKAQDAGSAEVCFRNSESSLGSILTRFVAAGTIIIDLFAFERMVGVGLQRQLHVILFLKSGRKKEERSSRPAVVGLESYLDIYKREHI
ncbi:hypothetical protein J6590_002936 [Homalodisca vitripennis]|nr:hypothetical protein J6590_002936 [Homalodisca vitripennis]